MILELIQDRFFMLVGQVFRQDLMHLHAAGGALGEDCIVVQGDADLRSRSDGPAADIGFFQQDRPGRIIGVDEQQLAGIDLQTGMAFGFSEHRQGEQGMMTPVCCITHWKPPNELY